MDSYIKDKKNNNYTGTYVLLGQMKIKRFNLKFLYSYIIYKTRFVNLT